MLSAGTSARVTGFNRLKSLTLTNLEGRNDAFKDEHRSFLCRHRPQIDWITQHLASAFRSQLNPSLKTGEPSQGLTAMVLGASTGEECVRVFYELSQMTDSTGKALSVRVHGIDIDKRALQEADRRLKGQSALNGALCGAENWYARKIVDSINHQKMNTQLFESVNWHEEDVTRSDQVAKILNESRRSFVGPSIIFLNHTLRIFDPSERSRIARQLSQSLPESILAIGDNESSIKEVCQLPQHLILRVGSS
jgi:chemotaxis methyl-accepting protein methylase